MQDELTGTENRISIERRKYDQAVQAYNTYISTFPNSVIANASGMRYNPDYFDQVTPAEQKAPPTVSFGH